MKSTVLGILTLGFVAFSTTTQAQDKKFALLDANSDGQVTLEEFKLQKLKGLKPEVAEKKLADVEKKFSLLDVNSDGKLDATEFAAKKPSRPKLEN